MNKARQCEVEEGAGPLQPSVVETLREAVDVAGRACGDPELVEKATAEVRGYVGAHVLIHARVGAGLAGCFLVIRTCACMHACMCRAGCAIG